MVQAKVVVDARGITGRNVVRSHAAPWAEISQIQVSRASAVRSNPVALVKVIAVQPFRMSAAMVLHDSRQKSLARLTLACAQHGVPTVDV